MQVRYIHHEHHLSLIKKRTRKKYGKENDMEQMYEHNVEKVLKGVKNLSILQQTLNGNRKWKKTKVYYLISLK